MDRCRDTWPGWGWQTAVNQSHPKMRIAPGVAEIHQRVVEIRFCPGGNEFGAETLHIVDCGKPDVAFLDRREGLAPFGLADDLIEQRPQLLRAELSRLRRSAETAVLKRRNRCPQRPAARWAHTQSGCCPPTVCAPGSSDCPAHLGHLPSADCSAETTWSGLDRRPNESGIGPVNSLPNRYSRSRFDKLPRLSGISPLKPLLPRFINSRFDRFPKLDGNAPFSLLDRRERCVRLLRLPNDEGTVPFN